VREESERAAAVIRSRVPNVTVDVGLVLASGLAPIADHILSPVSFPYADLPGFVSPASGDAELIVGAHGTAQIAVLKGRINYSERGNLDAMRVPLETLALLGAKAVVFGLAAGSTRPEIRPGALIAIRDHINLTGLNPLIGDSGPGRSVDMAGAYDPVLRERFLLAAGELGRKTGEGVYMWFPGPSFETPSEIHAARMLGADLVGMAMVPDVIIARRLGMRVLAISMVTNYAAGVGDAPAGRDTMRVAGASIVPLTRVLLKFLEFWKLTR
jgi:purine-nucleoside phosphorylase